MEEFANTIIIDKRIVASIIQTLKSLDVRGFESNDRLVGVVQVLNKFMHTETVEDDKKSKKEDK